MKIIQERIILSRQYVVQFLVQVSIEQLICSSSCVAYENVTEALAAKEREAQKEP